MVASSIILFHFKILSEILSDQLDYQKRNDVESVSELFSLLVFTIIDVQPH